MPWKNDGYTIVNAFVKQDFEKLKQSITNNVIKAIRQHNVDFDEQTFSLDKYHKVVTSDDLHNKIIEITRNLENSDFDFDIDKLTNQFGNVLGYKLTS